MDLPREYDISNGELIILGNKFRIPKSLEHFHPEAEKFSHDIHTLNIKWCEWETPKKLINFVILFPRIKALNLERCDLGVEDNFLNALSIACPKLESLNIAHCGYFTDVGLSALTGLLNLTSLNLSGCVILKEWLCLLANACPQLEKLNLSRCNNYKLSDSHLEELPRFSNLNSLYLSYCDKITDAGMEVFEGCPNLLILDINSCRLVTDEGILYLARGCKKLKEIRLRWCDITDLGISMLALGCPMLTAVDLSFCKNVTGIGIWNMAKLCPNLGYLGISFCWGIEEYLKFFRTKYPRIKYNNPSW